MKSLVPFLLMILLLVPLAAFGESEDALTLFVATDLHYLAPELTDHGPFFNRTIVQGDGKVMAYSEELIEAFVDQVIDRHPDVLILSGDLTFNGERASHEALASKLSRVADAGIRVLVIPGNHDLNKRSAARFEGESYVLVDSVTGIDFRNIYRAYGYDSALSQDRASLSYVVSISPVLRLLMVDVNDTSPPGSVNAQTLRWIAEQLAQAQRDGCRVIAVSHQTLLDHSSLISSGFTIGNASVLDELYAGSPVLCNLSGHVHMQHIAESAVGVWDIVTSSLAVSPNQYGVLTLTKDALSYRTESVAVSAWAIKKQLTDPNLLNFSSYADAFFKEVARSQALSAAQQDACPKQLADFFADINAAYFAGRMDTFAVDEQLLARWQQQATFLSQYIESIVQESPRNHCALTLALYSAEE